MIFHIRLFPGKANDKNFQNTQKTLFLVRFGPILPFLGWPSIFLKYWAPSLFLPLSPKLPEKSRKSHWTNYEETVSRTDRRAGMDSWELPLRWRSKFDLKNYLLGYSIQSGSSTDAIDSRQQLPTFAATPLPSCNQEKLSDFQFSLAILILRWCFFF